MGTIWPCSLSLRFPCSQIVPRFLNSRHVNGHSFDIKPHSYYGVRFGLESIPFPPTADTWDAVNLSCTFPFYEYFRVRPGEVFLG